MLSSFAAETFPTPGILPSGSVFKNAAPLRRNDVLAVGFIQIGGDFGEEFNGRDPADAVRFSSLKIVWRISCAISVAEPWQCTLSVTSR
jgi:hypothetical protein